MAEQQYSFPKQKIRIVLAEKVHDAAREHLEQVGYSVTMIPRAIEHDELLTLIPDVHVLGVRSRSKLTRDVLQRAKKLLAVGCFSVGTDQVSLPDATAAGVPVFNAPHSSTRSVAELALGNIIILARRVSEKNLKMHQGIWDKNVAGAREVRQKVLGIVGYGHIGQQLSILAESIGMEVIFFDIVKKLPLGRAHAATDLDQLLSASDFVSLHVPATPQTKNMISSREIGLLKKGAFLLNSSRGTVLDLPALRKALEAHQLGGAALDVFPEEPTPAVSPFESGFQDHFNVILTPHIGGNTEEAQHNIGIEVANSLANFIDRGSTEGAVNFPCINLPESPGAHRILHVHRNVPGVLSDVNQIVSAVGANIEAQQLATYQEIGYLVMDVNKDLSTEVKDRITALPTTIKARILY